MSEKYYWVKYKERKTGWVLERGFDEELFNELKGGEKEGRIEILSVKRVSFGELMELAHKRDVKGVIDESKD